MKTANAAWVLLAIVWTGLYWPLLVGHVPAFRDAYHFYYPLEHWLDQQAREGDIFPQFNPRDGTGLNVPGEMSSGLFYPGRIVWWLPVLSVAQRMGLVLLLHTAIAGIGAAYAAKRMRLGAAPQLLAASVYSLSGPVFFQHVNPIYLISSAWLPWALAECWAMAQGCNRSRNHEHSRVRWSVWIAACSLMLLGGDPQATLHCGLISVLAIFASAWKTRSVVRLASLSWRLMLAVLIVTGLTAVQCLPTWYWYQATSNQPAIVSSAKTLDGLPTLLQAIEPTTYDVSRGSPYAYSVAPWHFVTLLWSNLLGHVLPANGRYLSAWPAEPRMWTASLSIGLMSVLVAISCLFHRETRRSTKYLWFVVFLSGTAMLGNYAPMWLLRNGLHWFGLETNWLPGDEVGGTYWLLRQIVPGYDAFRYPGKWSPLLAAGLTLCAAHGVEQWEQIQCTFSRALRCVIVLTILLSLGLFGATFSPPVRDAFHSWLSQTQPDSWLGPIDERTSFHHVVSSLMLACFLLLAALWSQKRLPTSWQPWCLTLLVIVEMSWSAHVWLVTAPAPSVAVRLPSAVNPPILRVWAGAGQANIARDLGNTLSLMDKLQYQQRFSLAKIHLLDTHTANLSAFMTLTPQALARVRHQLAQHDTLAVNNPELDQALAWLGVQRRLVRTDQLSWHSIDHAAPLVELAGPALDSNALRVKYWQSSRIGLNVETAIDARLVVRLLQDGGWRANLIGRNGAGSRIMEPQSSHLGLFQTLDIPAGSWDIELRYQAPGLVFGAWISVLTMLSWTAVVLFNMSCRRTDSVRG